MLNLPQKVSGISHPLVRDIYLKKDFGYGHRTKDVLVIEANNSYDNTKSGQSFLDLLTDLQDIQNQAKQSVGHFDRVDIITN